jgi:hypothetical protein
MKPTTLVVVAAMIAATAAMAITPIVSMSAFAVKDTRCGPHGSGSGDPHDAENPTNPHDTQLGFNTGNPHDDCVGS